MRKMVVCIVVLVGLVLVGCKAKTPSQMMVGQWRCQEQPTWQTYYGKMDAQGAGTYIDVLDGDIVRGTYKVLQESPAERSMIVQETSPIFGEVPAKQYTFAADGKSFVEKQEIGNTFTWERIGSKTAP